MALAFWPDSGAPGWAAAVLIGLGVLQIVTDLTLSTKSSDWKKFAREKGVARAPTARHRARPGRGRGLSAGAVHR